MANAQLIQMAKDIGKSKGFNDVGKAFEQSFGKWVDQAKGIEKAQQDKRAAGVARVVDFMEKMPTHQSLPKVPAYTQDKVGVWLKDIRKQYGDHARATRDLDAQDPSYQGHISEMNRITHSMTTLNDQFDSLLSDKVAFMEGVDLDSVSKGNSAADIDELSRVYTDATEMEFSADGHISFGGKSFNDLPKWIEKNNTIPMALTQLNAKYYKTAQPVTGPLADNLKVEVEALIKSSGRPGVMSLAADGSLGIPDAMIHDPKQYDALVELVTRNWVDAITESAAMGKTQQDAEWKMKHPVKKEAPKYDLDKYFFKKKHEE